MVIKRKMICMNKKLALAASLLAAIMLTGSVLADDITVGATVSGYLTATFQYSAVTYAPLSADTHDTAAPDQAAGAYNVTVDTNANYKVSASGTNFTDGGGHTIDIGNLKMDAQNSAGSLDNTTATVLTAAPQEIRTGLTPSDTLCYHGYYMSVPAAQYAAAYSSTVTVTLAAV